jgi:hypothetical protein
MAVEAGGAAAGGAVAGGAAAGGAAAGGAAAGGAAAGGAAAGGAAPAWYEAIPEGPARDHVIAKGYKDPSALAVANYNLTRIHTGSADVIERPAADATPDQVRAFYDRANGVSADTKYDLKFGEGVQVDPALVDSAKGWFKDAGVRPDQAQTLAEKWNTFVSEATAKQANDAKAANDAQIAQLRQKYAGQGPTAFDQLVANGQKAAQTLGLSAEFLDRLDAANGVAVNMELLSMLGAGMGVEAPFRDGAPGAGGVNSPEAARVELAKLAGDKAFADSLMDPRNSMHHVNMTKHQDLMKLAYGKPKK